MEKYFEANSGVQLIHFTHSFENVKSILEDGSLKLKYCKEEFHIPSKKISHRVHPMVCFSEQNTNLLHSKKITYGRYGIAFSQEWIIRNNIQPVMYIEQKSEVAKSLSSLLIYRRRLGKKHLLRLPIMTIACFVKNTIGNNSHNGDKSFLFKEENEWRYIPTKKQIGGWYISESISVYLKRKIYYDNKLSDYSLKFQIPSDIVSIYCNNEDDCQKLETQFPDLKNVIKIATWLSSDQ